MNTQPNTSSDGQAAAPAAAPAMTSTRPMYWSVRRELWENRSIYIAPLAAAAVVLLGFAISTIGLPERRRAVLLLEPLQQCARIEQPYDIAAMMLMLTAFIVAVFYCLDALHGERRDRSILFWKSLPVSDLTTVLSKASIPLVVLPLLTFAIIAATQLAMMLLSTLILLANGLSPATSSQLPLFQLSLILIYGLVTTALWQAPIYGWLLLVSAWARRATFLWAVLPLLAMCAVEKIAFDTAYFAAMLGHRLTGSVENAFVVVKTPRDVMVPMVDRLAQLDPVKFLSSPGLWIGLAFAAAFLAAAVRMRRNRDPI